MPEYTYTLTFDDEFIAEHGAPTSIGSMHSAGPGSEVHVWHTLPDAPPRWTDPGGPGCAYCYGGNPDARCDLSEAAHRRNLFPNAIPGSEFTHTYQSAATRTAPV